MIMEMLPDDQLWFEICDKLRFISSFVMAIVNTFEEEFSAGKTWEGL